MLDMNRMPQIYSQPVFGFIPNETDELKMIADFMFDHDDFKQYRLELCDTPDDAELHLVVTEMYRENGGEFRMGKPKKLHSMRRGCDLTTSVACLVSHYFGMQYEFGPGLWLTVTKLGRVLTYPEFLFAFANTRVHFVTPTAATLGAVNGDNQPLPIDDDIPF